MRIVMLDFDGVLNSAWWFESAREPIRDAHCDVCAEVVAFDPANVRRLNRITAATDAAIVVSSSWRYRYEHVADLRHLLRAAGVDGRIIGRTERWGEKTAGLANRGQEIKAWLDTRPVDSWIILDDVNEFADFGADRWIETSFANGGLLDEHVEQAIEMLREPSNKKIGELRE